MSENLPERLRRLRKIRGLRLKQIAGACGVSTSQASQWEHGERRIYASHVPILAEALGVTERYLLTGDAGSRLAAAAQILQFAEGPVRAIEVQRQVIALGFECPQRNSVYQDLRELVLAKRARLVSRGFYAAAI